jgi:hypothetical protein
MSGSGGEQDDAELAALLYAYEVELMNPAVRKDSVRVSAMLCDDFREFGSSGRVWDRAAILDLLATEPSQDVPLVQDFGIKRIARDAALATYRAVCPLRETVRSSLWVYRDGDWRMLFHQGTICRKE